MDLNLPIFWFCYDRNENTLATPKYLFMRLSSFKHSLDVAVNHCRYDNGTVAVIL